MKDFDAARRSRQIRPASERTFKLGDEIFVMRPVIPSHIMDLAIEIETAGTGAIGMIDQLIDEMCEPPAREKWAAVRARSRDEDPITIADVYEVVRWLFEVETSLPTSEPSPSGDGSSSLPTGVPSTDASPSPVSIQPISPADDFSTQATPTPPAA